MTQASQWLDQNVWHVSSNKRVVDIRKGGQFGWHSDFSGIVNATPFVSSPVICKVLQSPRGFNMFKDQKRSELWHQSFKALFELHAKSITGLDKTLNPSWGDTPFGPTGETLDVPTGMMRAKSNLQFSYNEKYGLPITQMVEAYNRLFIYDEDTMHPSIALEAKNDDQLDGLLDFYTWTMIFIEPSRYMEQANRCWIANNVAIKNSIQNQSKRDKASDNELLDFDLELSCTMQVGAAVDAIGNAILRAMRKTQADPMRAPAFINGTPAKELAKNGMFHKPDLDLPQGATSGFMEAMQNAERDMVQPG